MSWIVGAASLAALRLGTTAAAAQTLWRSARNTIVEPMAPLGGTVPPATEVDEVLFATFATGVDGNSADAGHGTTSTSRPSVRMNRPTGGNRLISDGSAYL